MKKYVFLGLILFTAVTLFGCGEKTTAISNPTDTSTASKSTINDNTDSESTISNSAESSSQSPASSLASNETEESTDTKDLGNDIKDLNFQRYWVDDDFFDLKAYAEDHGYKYQCIVVQAGFDDDGNLITTHNAVLESMDKDARLILVLNGFSVSHVSGGGFGSFEFKKDPRNIKVDYDDEKLLIQDDVIFALPEIISLLDDTKGKKDMLKGSRFESGFEPGFFESN
jgi:lipoprotein